jgi:glycosyltransferase involved in cell wall biosynthesis
MTLFLGKKITVVVCTYNRAELLGEALDSLVAQSMAPETYEILVVDNGSTDATPQVVEAFGGRQQVRYVTEQRLGLSHARNTGAAAARTPYVAYMDDDARADPGWLEAILEGFEAVTPRPVAVGGPIFPYYATPRADWFKDRYETYSLGETAHFLPPGNALFGSNMAFQRDQIRAYEGFDTRYGRSGKRLLLGEETALFLNMWRERGNELKLYYTPRAIVRHLVPAWKMSVSYQLRRAFLSGRTEMALKSPPSLAWRLYWLAGTPYEAARTTGRALFGLWKYRYPQSWLLDFFAPLSARIGSSVGLWG